MGKYTSETAFKKVVRNADTKRIDEFRYAVKNGTAGNRVLGAIDYLNKNSKYTIYIVNEKKFKTL